MSGRSAAERRSFPAREDRQMMKIPLVIALVVCGAIAGKRRSERERRRIVGGDAWALDIMGEPYVDQGHQSRYFIQVTTTTKSGRLLWTYIDRLFSFVTVRFAR